MDSNADHNSLCTWVGETINEALPRKYSSELLSLGEIEEIARLDDLVRAIKRKWPPVYYVAMRERDISNAKASHTQGQEVPKWAEGLTATELNSQQPAARLRYDALQILLVHSCIMRITTETAAVQGEDTNIDGPGGQGPN